MKISIDEQPSSTIVRCSGRFDAFEVDEFLATITPHASEGAAIDIALDNVDFVDSSALAALVRTLKKSRESGGELRLLNPSDPVTVILELTRLDAAFDIVRG